MDNATITQVGGNYGYGGAINSGLAELTIVLVGSNKIVNDYDSLNSDYNCNITIQGSGSLDCGYIYLGRGDGYSDGSETSGNLTVDGATLTVDSGVFVQHDVTFRNGAQVMITGGLTASYSATVKVEGEETAVTVKSIAFGNDRPNQTNRLVLDSGTLTITGSVAFLSTKDEDKNPYAIHFVPASSGSIEINGGTFQTQEGGCKATIIPEEKIAVSGNLAMTGSWNGGSVSIVEKSSGGDKKVTVTVVGAPTNAGTVSPGGRYEPGKEVTVTAKADKGWFFTGWYLSLIHI